MLKMNDNKYAYYYFKYKNNSNRFSTNYNLK